jgi:hypothetical protein
MVIEASLMRITMRLFNAVTELTIRTTHTQVTAVTIGHVRVTPVIRIKEFSVIMPG